jgi:Fe-S cluster biogenesis protein NfuA
MSTETAPETPTPEATTAAGGISVEDKIKVMEVIQSLRPFLQADGGDCEVVDITDEGVVQLKLHGACGTCPSSTYTLKMGIEEQVRQQVPSITAVEQV